MKVIPPEKWTPCDGILLEDAANSAVRSDTHVLVIAGPGAGKTELLAQKASYLFQTNICKYPKKILAISFKTDAAQNLKERVIKRCGDDVKDRFSSMTYDAFAKSILDHFIYALPERLRLAPDYIVNDEAIVSAAFEKAGFRNNHSLSPSKVKQLYETTLSSVDLSTMTQGLGERAWAFLVKGFDGNKPTLTFKMIGLLADYIIQTNPKIKTALQQTYSHVFLDEFQDTTSFQYNFVKRCFGGSHTIITAVGDNKQRIMLWAGAMRGIFNAFYDEFAPSTARLLMNHRSAPRLVNLQKEMYESLKDSKTEIRTSPKWNPEDGEVSLYIFDDEHSEAHSVALDISKKIEDGVAPSDICVLCKQIPANYSTGIISELESMGIRARIENDYQDLIKEPIIDLVLCFLSCSADRKQPNKWETVVSTIMEIYGVDAYDCAKPFEALQYGIYSKVEEISALMKVPDSSKNLRSILSSIRMLLDDAHIKGFYPAYRQGNYLNELMERFENLFQIELNRSNNNWKIAVESFSGSHSIPIMTIHKSKGLEYSAVYFIGLEDSAFWNFKNQPEEDRCAFFVALSRAKESVAFTFCKKRSNLKYPDQSHKRINEFFELLQKPDFATVTILNSEAL